MVAMGTGNVRKRGNAPKYTTGLGDGHVDAKTDAEGGTLRQKVQSLRARNNLHHVKGGEKWLDRYKLVDNKADVGGGVAYSDDPAHRANNAAKQHPRIQRQHPPKTHGHDRSYEAFLDTPLMLLGAAVFVVMVSAVFFHLISSGNQEARKGLHQGRVLKKKHSRPHSRVRKKKTDEWNEDAEEEGLLSESVRNGGSADVADDGRATAAVYYPYQPRLQQHRHRKNSNSSQSNMVVVSQTNPQASVQHRNYYLNQSGAAVIAGNSFGTGSNVQKSPGAPQQQPPGKSASSRVLGSNYSPDAHSSARPQSARDLSSAYPSLQQPTQQELQQQSLYQGTGLAARPLSTTAESFESLTGSYDEENHGGMSDSLLGHHLTPQRNSPHASSVQQQKFTVLGSPKPTLSSDQEEDGTPKIGQSRIRNDLFDKTPRIANGRPTVPMAPSLQPSVPEHSQLAVGGLQQRSSDDDSVDLMFAAPPEMRRRNQQQPPPQPQPQPVEEDSSSIPFVPFLDVHVAPDRPPRSISVDDLHLYRLMESGNVSHWEERIAEESRQLQKKEFPEPSADDFQATIMASAAPSSTGTSSDNSIPSDDPRKGIQHKRADLTIATDAAASLQGAIDFNELNLIDVIGGGGFGQVWKAMWRGTPVAVKVLTGSAQSQSVPRAVLEEFAAEINLLKGMRHPNICLYMGACLVPPNRAIITELAANGSLWDALRLPLAPPYIPCDGITRDGWPMSLYQPDSKHGVPPTNSKTGSLSSVPPRGTWHWILVKRVACGAARGMAYLHSGKPAILHRDLKSANILLDDSYTAKVCDFGLSRLRAAERSMTGNVGTVQWMPPEVLANQSYNEKADVYSYGIICWELLTRQCPYDKMTPIQCALAVLNRNQRPEIPKWCPPGLQALIRSCLKRDPDERPSFPEILDVLDRMP